MNEKELIQISIDDIYELKKKHACGENKWQVVRIGADCKIKCLGCEHIILIDRVLLKKSIKKKLN